jgi:hypothetical protein
MRLYLSSRRFPSLVVAAVLVAASPAVGHLAVAFPRVIGEGGGTVIPPSSLAPLVLALLFAFALTSRRTHLAQNAVRATGWLDACLLLLVELVVVGITVVMPGHDWTVARNALLLVGLCATATCLLSPAAASALVTVFVLLVVTYGTAAPGGRLVRVLQAPPGAPWPLALALGATLLGSVLLAVAPRRR